MCWCGTFKNYIFQAYQVTETFLCISISSAKHQNHCFSTKGEPSLCYLVKLIIENSYYVSILSLLMFRKISIILSAAKEVKTYLYQLKWFVFVYCRYASQSKVVIINLFSISITQNENRDLTKPNKVYGHLKTHK